MNANYQWVETDIVYRYSRTAGPECATADGYPNFKYALRPRKVDQTILQLERGINASKEVVAHDGPRRPVVLLRSSPHKAGTEQTPWHDEFDLEAGRIRYFGDSKPAEPGTVHRATGNTSLLSVAPLFQSTSRADRQIAPPIAVFRGESVEIAGKGLLHKGFVRFVGVGLLIGHQTVTQASSDGIAFDNVVFDIRLCPLEDTNGRVDWNWVNDRRDESVPKDVANLRAPYPWRYWIETGSLPD